MYVHGGAWRGGSKEDMPLGRLLDMGFPVASVDYRLSTQAKFPAMVHDIKAAIRFLRAMGSGYGVKNTRNIAIVGSSAGGHLAALVGTSNQVAELNGTVGTHLDASSDVQACISLFGASNLQTILSQSTPQGLKMRVPALDLLLGGQPEAKPELARLASPVAHLDAKDPPLLLIHGDADPQMPYEQAMEFERQAKAAGAPVQFITIKGGRHGGRQFYDTERAEIMAAFLDRAAPKP